MLALSVSFGDDNFSTTVLRAKTIVISASTYKYVVHNGIGYHVSRINSVAFCTTDIKIITFHLYIN